MKSHHRNLASLSVMAALAMAGSGIGGAFGVANELQATSKTATAEKGAAAAVKKAQQNKLERAFLGRYGIKSRPSYPGYGWSVAHDRRMARKARNKARNRAAHR
ncbi:hypothetical protein [Roseateles sp. PN1]|uniref:hypothetical protein n=1 Tax=Roseateles sp. PN1 TaxID=3137372 RepID=UPI0031394376